MKCTLTTYSIKELRRYIAVSVLFIVVLILVGCTPKQHNVMDSVAEAEEIVITNPAEALRIIESVDSEKITKDDDMGYYALVYSEARYYNRILVKSDSLTRLCVEEYRNEKDHDRRARAYFQHAMVLQLNDSLPEAMIALTESLKSLDKHENIRLRGVVNRTMGDIYRARYCYPNSIVAYSNAYQCFKQIDLPYHCNYTKYNIGQAAVKMHSYNQAEKLFAEVRDYAIETGDMDFLCAVLHELCEIYFKQKDYDKCRETLDLFDQYDCVLWFVSRYYAMKAIVSAEDADIEEAHRLVAMALAEDESDKAIIEEAYYHIYKNSGDMENALLWQERINARLEESLLMAAHQPVLNYQIDLLQSNLDREEQYRRSTRLRNISIYVLIAIVLSLLIGFLRGYASKKNRDIQQYINTIHELQLTTHAASDSLSEAVDRLYNDRLSDLNRLCETYYEFSDTSRHTTKVFEQVRQTIESIKSDEARIEELEKLVNSCRGNLMQKLREQCPKLNTKEQRVVLYSYAGFSSRAICTFMDTNPVALSKVKYRIKLKIKESGANDADLFIESIGDH
jgi:tetratricopeptide (TPR) repeat protein